MTMMKSIILLLALIGFGVQSMDAQRVEDVIYLKNGEVRRGLIDKTSDKPYSEYDQVKITSRLGNVFIYSADKIDSITTENYFRKRYYPRKKGYYLASQFSLLFAINDNAVWPSLTIEQGYQFNPRNSIGAVFEIAELDYRTYRPVFLAARHSFSEDVSATYISGQIGYAFPWRDGWARNRYLGGILIGSNIGKRVFTTDNTAVDLTIGYRYTELTNIRTNLDRDGNDIVTRRNTYLSIIRIGAGVYFK